MNHIFLTGGTSKRFGRDKSTALLNGKTLLEYATEGLTNVIVVGPETSAKHQYVSEEPKFGGPVAAIAAGMKLVKSDLVGIFAIDMPFAPRLINILKSSLINDAALPLDSQGEIQPLAGIYRSQNLQRALDEFEDIGNKSMRSLVAKLTIDEVMVSEIEYLLDIDTPKEYLMAIDLASRLGS